MKKCRKCGKELPLEEFYAHPKMLDGHLNICKDCVKNRVSKYRENNLEKIRAYDGERGKLTHRKELRKRILEKRRRQVNGYEKAHLAAERAVVKGELTRSNVCQVCGKSCKTEGHHYDYAKGKSVIWLCSECHRQYHTGKTERAMAVQGIINNIVELKIKF